jgi:hypothetical protein
MPKYLLPSTASALRPGRRRGRRPCERPPSAPETSRVDKIFRRLTWWPNLVEAEPEVWLSRPLSWAAGTIDLTTCNDHELLGAGGHPPSPLGT